MIYYHKEAINMNGLKNILDKLCTASLTNYEIEEDSTGEYSEGPCYEEGKYYALSVADLNIRVFRNKIELVTIVCYAWGNIRDGEISRKFSGASPRRIGALYKRLERTYNHRLNNDRYRQRREEEQSERKLRAKQQKQQHEALRRLEDCLGL